MNIAWQFADLFEPQQVAVARIVSAYGSKWIANTMGGDAVVLTGQGEIGQSVYYSVNKHQIIEPAPSVAVVEMPV